MAPTSGASRANSGQPPAVFTTAVPLLQQSVVGRWHPAHRGLPVARPHQRLHHGRPQCHRARGSRRCFCKIQRPEVVETAAKLMLAIWSLSPTASGSSDAFDGLTEVFYGRTVANPAVLQPRLARQCSTVEQLNDAMLQPERTTVFTPGTHRWHGVTAQRNDSAPCPCHADLRG